MAEGLALDIRELAKVYGNGVLALDNVAMQVPRGEIFGLLGPNGAGKSTLVKCLMTIVRPSRCSGELLGRPIGDRATFARVGYLPEHIRFPEYLTGEQLLDYVGGLARVPAGERRQRMGTLLELVDMSRWGKTKLGVYSKGMKQRIGLAQSMINDPEFCFLDEPTDGVDPVGRRDIRDVLLRLRGQGKTIFINSHLLGEVEMICDRVAILSRGRVARAGTVDELTRQGRRYEIRLAEPLDPIGLATLGERLPAGLELLQASPGVLHLSSDDPAAAQPVIDDLRASGRTIVSFQPVRRSLEELFMASVEGGGK